MTIVLTIEIVSFQTVAANLWEGGKVSQTREKRRDPWRRLSVRDTARKLRVRNSISSHRGATSISSIANGY